MPISLTIGYTIGLFPDLYIKSTISHVNCCRNELVRGSMTTSCLPLLINDLHGRWAGFLPHLDNLTWVAFSTNLDCLQFNIGMDRINFMSVSMADLMLYSRSEPISETFELRG